MVWPKFKNKLDSETFANIAEDLRQRALLLPFEATVTSTIRTPEYNKSVGGVPNSQHLTGGALDYRIRDLPPAKVALLKKHFTDAGFQVINEGDHLHVQHAKGGATNADAPLQDPNKLPALPSMSGRTAFTGKSGRGPLQNGYSTAQLSDAMFPDLGGFGLAAMRGAGQAASKMINTGIEGAAYFNPMNQGAMVTKAMGINSPINAQQEILNNLFKSTLKKAAGTDAALASGPTEFERMNTDPLLQIGGTTILPSAGSLAYGVGAYAPEMAMTAYGAGPMAAEAVMSRLPAGMAPAVASNLSSAAATSAGAFTGGMLKGEPQEAYINALTFPAMQLGAQGAVYYAKQAGNYLKETPFLRNQRGSIGIPPKGGLPGEATPGQIIGPDDAKQLEAVPRATVPEASSTLLAQIESAKAGLSKAVLITPGEVVPEIPKGLVTETTSAGTFIFDPKKISSQTIQRKVKNGSFGELLGHVEPKSPATTQAVAALNPVTGQELKTSVVSPQNVAKQTEILQGQFPQAKVVNGGDDLTAKILEQRISGSSTLPKNWKPLLPGQKESKFIDSVRNSEMATPELASGIANNYNIVTDASAKEYANNLISQDFEMAVRLAKGELPDKNSVVLAQLAADKLQRIGRVDEAIDIINSISAQASSNGQKVQALSAIGNLEPVSLARYAEREFENFGKSLPEFKKLTLKKNVNTLSDKFKTIQSETADKVVKELIEPNAKEKAAKELIPDEILSKRIINYIKEPTKSTDPDPIKDMVNTLFKVAKETLPNKSKPISKSPIQFIAEAIKNRGKYLDAWQKAKEIVSAKYANNPEVLSKLSEYFGRQDEYGYAQIPDQPYSVGQITKAMQLALKDSKVDLGNLVKKHFTETDKAAKSLADKLVEQAGLSGEDAYMLSESIQKRFAELATDKKTQLLSSMFKEKLKPNIKTESQKIIEWSNLGAINSEKFKPLIAKKLGIPVLTDDLVNQLTKWSEIIKSLPEDSRQRAVATQQMLKVIADEIPPTFLKKVASLQVLNQLLNLKTFTRNIIGNTAFNILENVNQALATGIDKGVSKVLGSNRTITLPNLKAQVSGGAKGLKEGLEDAILGIDTSNVATQFDLPKGQVFKSFPLKQAEKTLNISLRVADRAFTEAAIQGDIANQIKLAQINGVTPNMDVILKHAKQVGEYRTFQDSTNLGKSFSGIKKYLNLMTGSEDFGAGNLVLNYPKTPANIINRGVAYTPFNYARAVYEAGKGMAGKGFDQEAFVNSISRATVGSGIISMGYFLAKAGLLTGRPTSDTDLRNLEKDTGKSGYQINVSGLERFAKSGNIKDAALQEGDKLNTFDWLQPNAIQLAIGANHALKEDGDLNAVDAAVEAAKSGVDTLSEQPLISSLATVFGNKSRDKSKILSDAAEVLFTSIGSSFVPSALRQSGQKLDNARRNPYDPNTSQYALNLIKAKIPGLAQTLPVKHGVLGQEQQTFQDGSNTFFNVFLNPSFSTTYKPTPEAKMVIYLNNVTGETKHVPRQLDYKQTMQGLTIKLDAVKYEELQKVAGEMTKQVFVGLANDPNFTAKPANEQVKILGDKLTDIGKQAKILVLGNEFKSLAVKESALKAALVDQEINNASFDKKADSYFDSIKDLPPEQLRQEINNLRASDYRLYKELKQRQGAVKSKSIPVADAELKQFGVDNGFRAKQIIKNTLYMSQQEKEEYFNRLRASKIITPFIQRQINNIENGQ